MFLHSVNVPVYAPKVGEGVGYNRDQLIDLGVAALLHDVGVVALPPDILFQRAIDPAGYRNTQPAPHQGPGHPRPAEGQRYPRLRENRRCGRTYAGLTRSSPERRGLLPFKAVKEVLQNHKHKFDIRMVRVLLRKLSAFPVDSLAKLNSGTICTVIETDEANQLRPVIRVFYDAQDRRVVDDRIIHLREYPILHITDVIYEEDLE